MDNIVNLSNSTIPEEKICADTASCDSANVFVKGTLYASNSPVTEESKLPQKLTYKRVYHQKGKYYQQTGKWLGQCVIGVNKIVGRRVVQGWAGAIKTTVPPNKITAGMVIITREGGGHAVLAYKENATCFFLHESNYDGDGMESIGRCLPKDSPLIKGGIAI